MRAWASAETHTRTYVALNNGHNTYTHTHTPLQQYNAPTAT